VKEVVVTQFDVRSQHVCKNSWKPRKILHDSGCPAWELARDCPNTKPVESPLSFEATRADINNGHYWWLKFM